MDKSISKITQGYNNFREKYSNSDENTLRYLMKKEQTPEIMVVSCCDSRVDPAIIFECDPGDLFVVRNIANIVPPYEKDSMHHGTSAALEFGINFLKVKHLILLGHSNCGGIKALMDENFPKTDFISNWLSVSDRALMKCNETNCSLEECIKLSLTQSYNHCLTFPWIKEKIEQDTLRIHRWFLNLETGMVEKFDEQTKEYNKL